MRGNGALPGRHPVGVRADREDLQASTCSGVVDDDTEDARFRAALDALSEHDDGILAAIVGDVPVAPERLESELTSQTRRALVHPVSFGSAMTGAGVDAVMQSITSTLLPPLRFRRTRSAG